MMYKIELISKARFISVGGRKLIEICRINDPNGEEDSALGFYDNLKTFEYPKFLKDTLIGMGAYSAETSFYIGPDDEDGYIVKEDEVHFWGDRTEIIIPLEEFEKLNLQLAHKSLEAVNYFNLEELGYVDQQWIDDIKGWITKKEGMKQ
jgi:hypothetical protein